MSSQGTRYSWSTVLKCCFLKKRFPTLCTSISKQCSCTNKFTNKCKYANNADTIYVLICNTINIIYNTHAKIRIFYEEKVYFYLGSCSIFPYPGQLFGPIPDTPLRNHKEDYAFRNEDVPYKTAKGNILRRGLDIYCWDTGQSSKGGALKKKKKRMQKNRELVTRKRRQEGQMPLLKSQGLQNPDCWKKQVLMVAVRSLPPNISSGTGALSYAYCTAAFSRVPGTQQAFSKHLSNEWMNKPRQQYMTTESGF